MNQSQKRGWENEKEHMENNDRHDSVNGHGIHSNGMWR